MCSSPVGYHLSDETLMSGVEHRGYLPLKNEEIRETDQHVSRSFRNDGGAVSL